MRQIIALVEYAFVAVVIVGVGMGLAECLYRFGKWISQDDDND